MSGQPVRLMDGVSAEPTSSNHRYPGHFLAAEKGVVP